MHSSADFGAVIITFGESDVNSDRVSDHDCALYATYFITFAESHSVAYTTTSVPNGASDGAPNEVTNKPDDFANRVANRAHIDPVDVAYFKPVRVANALADAVTYTFPNEITYEQAV
jgi:hypothetical protein